jgi:hypothetical protein
MRLSKFVLAVLLVLMALLNACSKAELTEKDFVGTWRSTRSTTPIRLLANGEWELTSNDGSTLQYGVWQYFDNKIMWSFILDDVMGHDTNPIVAASPREFKLRENDGSITTFSKLD